MTQHKQRFLILPEKQLILDLDKGFRPNSPRSYSRDIKKLYEHSCVISNLKEKELIFVDSQPKAVELAVHHIYNQKHYPMLKMSLLNGLPLTKELHKNLHYYCGQKTDATTFINYLRILQRDSFKHNYTNIDLLIKWVEFLNTHLIIDIKKNI